VEVVDGFRDDDEEVLVVRGEDIVVWSRLWIFGGLFGDHSGEFLENVLNRTLILQYCDLVFIVVHVLGYHS